MRKICFLAVSFLIFLLSFSFFSSKANAAEDLTASASPKPEVNYELPYPGLLPDSPLYFLRVTRDRIISFLISDSLKKSEFNLLQADKRLNASIYLFNKGKISLAVLTISKAENYFSEALDKMEEARIQGRNINDIAGKLSSAVKKHRQELANLSEKAGANFKPNLEKELKRVVGFEERLGK